MYSLPTSVSIDGTEFKIRNKGDFRVILDCFNALNDITLPKEERLLAALYIFYDLDELSDINNIENIEEATKQMNLFFNCGQAEVGMQTKYKLIDWEKDSPLISSAINNVSKTEIRTLDYLHWWTFMGYYLAIGDCPLANIVNIRHKIASGTKLEKYEQKFRMENPQYFSGDYRSNDQKELEQWFLEKMWNKK